MNKAELLNKIRTSGNKALTESESKQLLGSYGVPVVSETVALSEDEAVKAARKTGFPVVLKGLGATLLHKTERGLVHLNLADEKAVRNAATLITREAADELEGFLVQPQVQGKREFVAVCSVISSSGLWSCSASVAYLPRRSPMSPFASPL